MQRGGGDGSAEQGLQGLARGQAALQLLPSPLLQLFPIKYHFFLLISLEKNFCQECPSVSGCVQKGGGVCVKEEKVLEEPTRGRGGQCVPVWIKLLERQGLKGRATTDHILCTYKASESNPC